MKKVDFCLLQLNLTGDFSCKIYKDLNFVFCFGLQKMESEYKIKIFHSNLKKKNQGASLFKTPEHINLSESIPVLDTDYFCKCSSVILDTYEDNKLPKMFLRLNCEGTEDDIIYSIHSTMSN